jgi:rhamnose transport system permease protein
MRIKAAGLDAAVGTLSGGNQQKVMLAKWLNTNPKLLIVDEPTRGIDVGAKAEVHRILRDLAGQGVAILVISSDLPEVLSLADRVLVMREGRLVGEFPGPEATEESRHAPRRGREGGGMRRGISPGALRLLVLLGVFALTVLFFSSVIENYLSPRLFNRISTSVAIVAVIAVGQAFVVLTRNIDLSVGSVVGCTAYFLGGLLAVVPGIPAPLVPLVAMAMGAVFGAVNGFLVSRFNLPSIIVTLGTLAIFRSILVQSSNGASITTSSVPAWVPEFAQANAFEWNGLQVRWMVLMALAVVLVAHLVLSRLRAGRRFYAVGSNPDAAAFAGIDLRRTVFQAFVISGALAGLAGFMFLSRFGNITVVAGLGLELKSVGAVVVGGVNIFGGSGSVLGVLIGAALIDLIDNSLVRWEVVSEFWREAVLGLLILLAVVLDATLSRRLLRRRMRRGTEAPASETPRPAEANP